MDPNSLNESAEALNSPEEQPAPESSSPELDPSAPEEAQEASPDAEGGEEGEGEATEETPEEGAEEAPAKDAPKRKRNGFERKIDRLERQLEQALSALNGRPGQPPAPVEPQKQLTPEEKAALDFKQYIRQEAQSLLAEERAYAQEQRVVSELQAQMNTARSKYDDFDDVVQSAPRAPPHVEAAILQSENKAEIIYSLAKNKAVLARICVLPPLQAALEVGRLDAKFAAGPTQATQPKPAIRPPAPPSKVNGASAPSTRRWDELSLSEHKRLHRSK